MAITPKRVRKELKRYQKNIRKTWKNIYKVVKKYKNSYERK